MVWLGSKIFSTDNDIIPEKKPKYKNQLLRRTKSGRCV